MPRTLPKLVSKSKKRVGRGIGSGKGGHTVGRGQKGQKSRGDKVGVTFEGLKMKKSLIKRLPFKRGKGKFLGHSKPVIVFLESLEFLPAKSKVNIESLVSSGIVDAADAKSFGVKILGNGNISKALNVLVPISAGATEKIKKAGGSVGEIKA